MRGNRGYQEDNILRNNVDNFIKESNLNHLTNDDDKFEYFANYCVVSRGISNKFDPVEISVGRGTRKGEQDSFGIDGIAIMVNEHLVTSEEQIGKLVTEQHKLDVDFIFIQVKNSNKFDTAEIAKFGTAVSQFFSYCPKVHKSERAQKLAKLKDYIWEERSLDIDSSRYPVCRMYYVTTGRLQQDENLQGTKEAVEQMLITHPNYTFSASELHLIDLQKLHQMCGGLNSRVVEEITLAESAPLPTVGDPRKDGVSGYIGTVTAKEFLKIITYPGDGLLRRNLFHENVRDYQGNNPVNRSIARTIAETDKHDQFVLRNNGITIVAKSMNQIGKTFELRDYQIVNGCQTSHVLYINREHLKGDKLHLPIKLLATSNSEISGFIIEGTNSQTEVDRTAFLAGQPFHQNLEAFYKNYKNTSLLLYERRSKQYENFDETGKLIPLPEEEADRIVTVEDQARYFVGMFLEKPHEAHNKPYHTLLKDYKAKLFVERHLHDPYYISSYAHYVLQKFFNETKIDASLQVFRYHIMMLFRIEVAGRDIPDLSGEAIKNYCERLKIILSDEDEALKKFKGIAKTISAAWEADGYSSDDTVKSKKFTDTIIVGKNSSSKIVIGEYKEGDDVEGKVLRTTSYGAFLELPNGMKGLIHISNLSWLKVDKDKVEDILKENDVVKVRILEIDKGNRRIELSLKELEPNPWDSQIPDKYPIGEIVRGKIVDIKHFGAYAELEPGLSGLIRNADLAEDFVNDPNKIVSLGEELELMVIKLNPVRQSIGLSLKATTDAKPDEWLNEISKKFPVNSEVRGKIVSIVPYGAYAELEPGLNGLIHISELSHERIEKVDDIVSIDNELDLIVIALDPAKKRISLSLKALKAMKSAMPSEWHDGIPIKYPIDSVVRGKIVTVTHFGAFVKLEDAPDALIHNDQLCGVVNVGDELDLKVIRLDARQGRINLSQKAMDDPWHKDYPEKYTVGSVVRGKIVRLEHFGAFAELEPRLNGLIHRTELSDNEFGHPVEVVSIDEELDLKVIKFDPNKNQINLSLKAIDSTRSSPWIGVSERYPPGAKVNGRIVRIENYGAFAELEARVIGFISSAEFSEDRVDDPNEIVEIGEELDFVVIQPSRKKRNITLSLKAVPVEQQVTEPEISGAST